jgi:choline dehydrogenase
MLLLVGAGAAGSVVAKRLSTNKNVKVLLLEAGGDPSPLNHIPGIAIDLVGYKNTDWMFRTVPQKNACWGLENNVMHL